MKSLIDLPTHYAQSNAEIKKATLSSGFFLLSSESDDLLVFLQQVYPSLSVRV
jgi:hypothetical protein